MDFEFSYKVTYSDGKIFESKGHGIIPISKDDYKIIINSVLSGTAIADIKGIPSVISRMKEHAEHMAAMRLHNPLLQVSKAEYFLPDEDVRRFKKYPNPNELIDRPTESMEIYRSNGTCIILRCENGLVTVDDLETGERRQYDTDEFAIKII